MEKLAERSRISKFLTGSKFIGNCDKLGMQGYGLYVYPDDSKYLGQFHNNRFHGRGTIELAHPYGMLFSVLHDHGKLVQIHKMSFSDTLAVDFTMTGEDEMSFDEWNYCTAEDRRFNRERLESLPAVGPDTFLDRLGPSPIPLTRNVFDLGFGELSKIGFISKMPAHISQVKHYYVGCRKVRRWIRENCRHGPLKHCHIKQEVQAKFARQIIRNNTESALEESPLQLHKPLQATWHKSKVCRRYRSQETSESAKLARLHLASTSRSSSSIMDYTVKRGPQYKRRSKSFFPVRRSKTEENVCNLN